MLLVVVNDGGRNVEEIAAVEVVAAGHAQVADGDAAEQTQPRRFEADAGAGELGGELGVDLPADGGGVGPRLVQQGRQGHDAQDGEDQTSDQPLPPGHGLPV